MPKIVFASNNIAHWPTSLAGSVPGTFDENRVPYAIQLRDLESLNSPEFIPVTGDETWFNLRCYAANTDYNAEHMFLQSVNDDGKLLFQVRKKQSTRDMKLECVLYDGNTSLNQTSAVNMTFNRVNIISVKYVVNDLGISLELYVNGSLGASLSLASNPNLYTAPNRFSMGHAFGDPNEPQYNSEIIVADGDTRNARLDLLRPTAAGAHSQWLGSLAALADDDMTTGMTTIAADQRQTVSLTAYTGASNISNIVAVSNTTRGLNSPTKIKHTVRLATVDYDSPEIPVGYPLQYNLTDWQINPATSLPWVGSDLSLIETGFVSVA